MATVLAHAGFELAQESVLETLTDLVHEHYLRITRLLRVAVDREARLGASPFPDVVEQVFHEVGIGSVLALQRFWQVRIKDYHSYMLQVSLERDITVNRVLLAVKLNKFDFGILLMVTHTVMQRLFHISVSHLFRVLNNF